MKKEKDIWEWWWSSQDAGEDFVSQFSSKENTHNQKPNIPERPKKPRLSKRKKKEESTEIADFSFHKSPCMYLVQRPSVFERPSQSPLVNLWRGPQGSWITSRQDTTSGFLKSGLPKSWIKKTKVGSKVFFTYYRTCLIVFKLLLTMIY